MQLALIDGHLVAWLVPGHGQVLVGLGLGDVEILAEDIAPTVACWAIRRSNLLVIKVQTFLQECVALHGLFDPGDLELFAVDRLARTVGVLLLARDLVPEVVPVIAIAGFSRLAVDKE